MSSYSIVELFEEKTQYKLSKLLDSIVRFIENDYPTIVQFYSSQKDIGLNIKDTYIKLRNLHSEVDLVLSILQNNSDSLDSRYWELVEMIDEIKITLEYIEQTPKWLRSAVSKGRYSYGYEREEVLKQNETIEGLSKRLGSSNKDNDWVYIALRNDLEEEGYSSDGGNELQVQGFNRLSIELDTVVDSGVSGEKVYGVDINKKLSFRDNDLDILGYKETVRQAVDILCGLKMGDNPEFPQDGIPVSLSAGSNRNMLPISIIRRQLQQTFQKDDTLASLLISKISIKGDSLSIDLEVETRNSEIIEKEI